jgi:hypothetical protein
VQLECLVRSLSGGRRIVDADVDDDDDDNDADDDDDNDNDDGGNDEVRGALLLLRAMYACCQFMKCG